MEKQSITKLLNPVWLVLCFAASSHADKPPARQIHLPADYSASYIVEKYDTQIARLQYRLQHSDGLVLFNTRAEVTGFAALFRDDSAEENSRLQTADTPRLLSYQYQQRGSKKNRNTRFAIDWQGEHGKAEGQYADKAFTLDVSKPVWDPLSVQLALMRDMALGSNTALRYPVIHKGKLKHYVFERLADDSIEIDETFYDAVVLQRRHNNRLTRFWLAKDYQYIPLQIENYRNGDLDTRILLDSFTLHE